MIGPSFAPANCGPIFFPINSKEEKENIMEPNEKYDPGGELKSKLIFMAIVFGAMLFAKIFLGW